MRILRLIVILGLSVFAGSFAKGQDQAQISPTPTRPIPSATTADASSLVLQYQAELRAAGQEHRRFLEYELDLLKWIVGVAIPIFGGILVFLNWKGRREIRAQVNARFQTVVDAEIENRLERFNLFLEENRSKIEQTDRLIELIYDLTYGFHVLSVKLDDPEWEAARRDAEASLQAWRVEMPTSRRLGILLGRLYKRLSDYDAAVRVLTEVLRERDDRRMAQDTDYAALLYNRGCYQTLKAHEIENIRPGEARSLRSHAWEDLNISIALAPENKEEAENDPDLETLWNDWPKMTLGRLRLSDLRKRSAKSTTSLVSRIRSWLGKAR